MLIRGIGSGLDTWTGAPIGHAVSERFGYYPSRLLHAFAFLIVVFRMCISLKVTSVGKA